MIDWEEIEKDLRNLTHNTRYELGTTDYHAEKILNYIRSLIVKEFKLVASGEVKLDSQFAIGTVLIDRYYGKNISIYISENKERSEN